MKSACRRARRGRRWPGGRRLGSSLVLALFVVGMALGAVTRVASAAGSPSASADVRYKRFSGELDRARQRGRPNEEADALYDLAKAHFDAGDLAGAEELMREAAAKESTLSRPDALIRTRVALAMVLAAAKKNDAAMAAYEEALTLARSHKKNGEATAIVNSMGALAMVEGKLDQAEQLFKQGRELARTDGNVASECNALVNLAVVSRSRNQYEAGIALLQEALVLARGGKSQKALCATLMELGSMYADMGKLDLAAVQYADAATQAEEDFDTYARGKALMALGQVKLKEHSFSESAAALKESSQLFAEAGNAGMQVEALVSLGAALAQSGEYARCDQSLAEAESLAKSGGDGSRQRLTLSEWGYSFLLRGQSERALNKFLEAYQLVNARGTPSLKVRGVLLTDIAMCYKGLGQTDAAISYYKQAVSDFETIGDQSAKATALNSLSVAYLDSGKAADFEQYHEQARALFKSSGDKHGLALSDYNMAQYHLLHAHYADAVPLYEEALAAMRASHDTAGEGQVLRGLGLAYIYLGRTGKSLECYLAANPLAQASGSLEAQWDCALGLGKAYKALGKAEQALTELERAVELVERERVQLSRDSFKTFNMDLRQDCFTELVDGLVQAGKIEQALVVAEKGRARAFLDLLEGRQTRRPQEALAQGSIRVDGGVGGLGGVGGVGGSGDGGSGLGRVTAQTTSAHGGSTDRGVTLLRKSSTLVESSAISPINALPPTLSEIKELVKKSGNTFVEYYVLPGKVLMWIIRPTGEIELAPPSLLSRRSLEEKVASNLKSITSHPKGISELAEFNRKRESNLRELHKILLEPVLPFLPKTPDAVVTIVPHGPLFLVPFAALSDEGGKFVVESHTLSYIPAIGVLRATQKLSAEAVKDKDKLLAFGNPIIKQIEFLGALPYSEKEVQHIGELFGPGRYTIEIGADATKATFRTLAPKSTVIHLATHGLIDEEHPMDSSLVLAPAAGDDGLLTVKDILQLPPLKARLITLSACQTGRGKITGDGVVGLSRAFIIAGTPSVIVSQWNVDDVMTEYEMVEFYKSFLASSEKAKALRQAQLKTIEFMEKVSGPGAGSTSGPKPPRANPRYWAAFQLIGDSGQ